MPASEVLFAFFVESSRRSSRLFLRCKATEIWNYVSYFEFNIHLFFHFGLATAAARGKISDLFPHLWEICRKFNFKEIARTLLSRAHANRENSDGLHNLFHVLNVDLSTSNPSSPPAPGNMFCRTSRSKLIGLIIWNDNYSSRLSFFYSLLVHFNYICVERHIAKASILHLQW